MPNNDTLYLSEIYSKNNENIELQTGYDSYYNYDSGIVMLISQSKKYLSRYTTLVIDQRFFVYRQKDESKSMERIKTFIIMCPSIRKVVIYGFASPLNINVKQLGYYSTIIDKHGCTITNHSKELKTYKQQFSKTHKESYLVKKLFARTRPQFTSFASAPDLSFEGDTIISDISIKSQESVQINTKKIVGNLTVESIGFLSFNNPVTIYGDLFYGCKISNIDNLTLSGNAEYIGPKPLLENSIRKTKK